MRISLFGCILLLSAFTAHAKIIETQNFKEIEAHVSKKTLILLDIDDTLLIPKQMLGCDEWFMYRNQQHKDNGKSASEALELAIAEWEAVRHITQMEIVEPKTDAIVAKLQEDGYTVMGLTTQGLALATRTSQQLLHNNIDLTRTCPIKGDYYITLNGHGVLYRQGILFTSGRAKGEALFQLLDGNNITVHEIVFINDKETHLADIERSAHNRGVTFIGLRYAYSDKRKALFDPKIAEVQFCKSSFNRILSDDEALKSL